MYVDGAGLKLRRPSSDKKVWTMVRETTSNSRHREHKERRGKVSGQGLQRRWQCKTLAEYDRWKSDWKSSSGLEERTFMIKVVGDTFLNGIACLNLRVAVVKEREDHGVALTYSQILDRRHEVTV